MNEYILKLRNSKTNDIVFLNLKGNSFADCEYNFSEIKETLNPNFELLAILKLK
jgi:hypothetical protein